MAVLAVAYGEILSACRNVAVIRTTPRRHPSMGRVSYHNGMSARPVKFIEDPAALERLTVSLKTLAKLLDAHRSSVRRWLTRAGIRPISLGSGANGAIRYRWRDVQDWLESRQYIK